MAPGAKKSVPLSIAPGVAAVVMALTLAIITGLFYKVADECSADYKHGSPIDIATYLCCNPDKIVSQIGFTLFSLLLLATAVPVYFGFLRKFASTGVVAGAVCIGALALTCLGLEMFAFIDACSISGRTMSSEGGHAFFFGALLFCLVYNSWGMSLDYGFACPGFNPPSFNMDDRLGSDPAAARLARSARIVRRARVLLSGVMVGSFIAQWCITTNQGWFDNMWVIVGCFELELLILQADMWIDSRRAAMEQAADGAPLLP